jgi:hypothetical protein
MWCQINKPVVLWVSQTLMLDQRLVLAPKHKRCPYVHLPQLYFNDLVAIVSGIANAYAVPRPFKKIPVQDLTIVWRFIKQNTEFHLIWEAEKESRLNLNERETPLRDVVQNVLRLLNLTSQVPSEMNSMNVQAACRSIMSMISNLC